jgi:hypothetical protein
MHSSEGEKILVMAATNRPQELDDAALRFVGVYTLIDSLPGDVVCRSGTTRAYPSHRASLIAWWPGYEATTLTTHMSIRCNVM